jgi:SagB-type dehydrogenase family enzyme
MPGIGHKFLEETKYRKMEPSAQQRGEPQPPLQSILGDGLVTELPAAEKLRSPDVELRSAIEDRRSVREYDDRPLELDELVFLLWATQGVRETLEDRATFRTVPSAGARHPLETVFLANRVRGLPVGFHQYDALRHRLIALDSPSDATERLTTACLGQGIVTACAVMFLWVADSVRMTWRYGERGFRYIHLDAGHVCQNLYLAAGAVGAGVCAVGAFDDDVVNELLGLDGADRFVAYLAAVGKLPPVG